MLELCFPGNRRQKDLFSQFTTERLRLAADGSNVTCRVGEGGDGPDGPDPDVTHGSDGNGNRKESRFSADVFTVMQGLERIVERDETTASDGGLGGLLDSSGAGERTEEEEEGQQQQQQQMDGAGGETVGRGGGVGTIRMSRTLARAFFRTSGGGATIRGGRGLTRPGSVRFSRRSSGGSTGFYRDAGDPEEEDDWPLLADSPPPSQPPPLPAAWRGSGSVIDVQPPPPPLETPDTKSPAVGAAAASGPSPPSSQPPAGGHSGGVGIAGGAGYDSVRSRGSGGESGGGTVSRSHHTRSLSLSSDREVTNHRRKPSYDPAQGDVASATAREWLLDRSTRSNRRVVSSHGPREALGDGGRGGGGDGGGGGGGGGNGGPVRAGGVDAPRLQLSDHGVRCE